MPRKRLLAILHIKLGIAEGPAPRQPSGIDSGRENLALFQNCICCSFAEVVQPVIIIAGNHNAVIIDLTHREHIGEGLVVHPGDHPACTAQILHLFNYLALQLLRE